MKYYEEKGAQKSKLVVGIPFYGQSFTLAGATTHYGAETAGPGQAGKWTNQQGMLAYYEICQQSMNFTGCRFHTSPKFL